MSLGPCLEHDFAIEICHFDSAPSQGVVISNQISAAFQTDTPRPIWVCETVSEGAICFGLTAIYHCTGKIRPLIARFLVVSNQNAFVSKLVIHPFTPCISMGVWGHTQSSKATSLTVEGRPPEHGYRCNKAGHQIMWLCPQCGNGWIFGEYPNAEQMIKDT